MDIIKWRKWHRKMERSGTKFKEFVVGYAYKSHECLGNFSMPLYKEYFLKIKYIDYFGVEKTFETPALSFCPEERNGVYIFIKMMF